MQPTQQVTLGSLTAYTRWRLEAPSITFTAPGVHLDPEYYDPVWFSDRSAQYPRLDGSARLRVVDAGTATAPELADRDLRGALALIRRSDDVTVAVQSNNAAAAGARAVAIYNDGPGLNADPGRTGIKLLVPTCGCPTTRGSRSFVGAAPSSAHGVASSPYQYELIYPERDGIPPDLHYTARLSQLAAVTRHFHGEPGRDLTYGESAFAFQPRTRSPRRRSTR